MTNAAEMPQVFISHSAVDADIARQLMETLESANLACWIAPRDIPAGATWGDAIIQGIEACRVMVLVFSSSSNRSGHVLREIERAVSKELVIIPFRVDDTRPSRDIEYFTSATQWLDARAPPLPERISELVDRIGSLTTGAVGSSGPTHPSGIRSSIAEPLKSATLCYDRERGSLLATDHEGRYRFWKGLSETPIAGRLSGQMVALRGERVVVTGSEMSPTSHVRAWVSVHDLGRSGGAESEPEWTSAFETTPDKHWPTVFDDVVVISTWSHRLGSQTTGVRVLDLATGDERLRLEDLWVDPFAFWGAKEALILRADRRLVAHDLRGRTVFDRTDVDELQGGKPFSIDRGQMLGYLTADQRLVVRKTEDFSFVMSIDRSPHRRTDAQPQHAFVSADGDVLVLVWQGGAVEGFDLRAKRLVNAFGMDDRTGAMMGGRVFGWDPNGKRLLLVNTWADGDPGKSHPNRKMRLWKLPEGDLVGIRPWRQAPPMSVAFDGTGGCLIGTYAGDVLALSLPGLRVERQLA